MERREVLRRTIAGGMTMVITHILPETPADAAELAKKKPKVVFHEGTLSGEGVEGWTALIATTGSSVRGTCWDPATVNNGHYAGWRVRGKNRNGTLHMDFFGLADHGFSKSIGKCGGKLRGKKFNAPFSLLQAPTGKHRTSGKSGGQMDVSEVQLSPAMQRDNAGEYVGEVYDNSAGVAANEPAGSFRVIVNANGKFQISDGTSNSPKLQGKLPQDTVGRWGMTEEGTAYTVTQADELVIADSPVDYSEVNKGALVQDAPRIEGTNVTTCVGNFCANCLCAAQSPNVLPPAPAGATVKLAANSRNSVQVDWEDKSVNELGFHIQRKTGQGDFATIQSVKTNVYSYVDANVSAGTYTYRVLAYNNAGSNPSNEASITVT